MPLACVLISYLILYATPQRAGGGACVRSLAVPPRRQELQLPRYKFYFYICICCMIKYLVATI